MPCNGMHHEGGAPTRTLDLLIGCTTPSQPSQQHPHLLLAVMIQFDLIGIYTRQIRLASKGWPRARVVQALQGSRYHRYDVDYDSIGYDIDYDIMTMILVVHTYDIIHDIMYDMTYDIIGQCSIRSAAALSRQRPRCDASSYLAWSCSR